jgi:hypothetical protein
MMKAWFEESKKGVAKLMHGGAPVRNLIGHPIIPLRMTSQLVASAHCQYIPDN